MKEYIKCEDLKTIREVFITDFWGERVVAFNNSLPLIDPRQLARDIKIIVKYAAEYGLKVPMSEGYLEDKGLSKKDIVSPNIICETIDKINRRWFIFRGVLKNDNRHSLFSRM